MTLTINLPDDLSAGLKREAERRGVDLAGFATELIRSKLEAEERAAAMHEMFAQWAAEDATDDPQEIARRDAEWEELKKSLNANRGSGRKLFPE